MTELDPVRLERAYQSARAALLAERAPEGHWVGELSTSALSTAVAISALSLVEKAGHGSFRSLIAGGLAWLAAHQNADGGWGDTIKSVSNISTTMLCRAAFYIAGSGEKVPPPVEVASTPPPNPLPEAERGSQFFDEEEKRLFAHRSSGPPSPLRGGGWGEGSLLPDTTGPYADSLSKSAAWLAERYGKTPAEIAEAVRARYGKDRTFSVPILMTSALAGLVSWREVPALPFELACFPQSWFRFLRLPVVSYALPALIVIGQAVHHHRRSWGPLWLVRRFAIGKSLRVLEKIQPSNGGFLEATPLTSFVALGLASTGKADHPVVRKCVAFIVGSVRPDGSWPIDTNLSTWVTTLAVNALAAAGDLGELDKRNELCDWLLGQQYQRRHPFTGAAPGGWAWTPLPGGVPDADDTPGALLALMPLDFGGTPSYYPINGTKWLLDLQNRNGGWPTFCRGWGALPFDRSGSDLTAHALRALAVWGAFQTHRERWMGKLEPQHKFLNAVPGVLRQTVQSATERGLAYLARQQRPDGSWLPLWFGNQHAPDDINPTYGTARVLAAYRDLGMMDSESARRGVAWLLANQNADGGWGGLLGTPSSIEETSLALDPLLSVAEARRTVERGLAWLVERVEAGGLSEPTPIGFYFAKLWYYEKMYPLVFAVQALGRARRVLAPGSMVL